MKFLGFKNESGIIGFSVKSEQYSNEELEKVDFLERIIPQNFYKFQHFNNVDELFSKNDIESISILDNGKVENITKEDYERTNNASVGKNIENGGDTRRKKLGGGIGGLFEYFGATRTKNIQDSTTESTNSFGENVSGANESTDKDRGNETNANSNVSTITNPNNDDFTQSTLFGDSTTNKDRETAFHKLKFLLFKSLQQAFQTEPLRELLSFRNNGNEFGEFQQGKSRSDTSPRYDRGDNRRNRVETSESKGQGDNGGIGRKNIRIGEQEGISALSSGESGGLSGNGKYGESNKEYNDRQDSGGVTIQEKSFSSISELESKTTQQQDTGILEANTAELPDNTLSISQTNNFDAYDIGETNSIYFEKSKEPSTESNADTYGLFNNAIFDNRTQPSTAENAMSNGIRDGGSGEIERNDNNEEINNTDSFNVEKYSNGNNRSSGSGEDFEQNTLGFQTETNNGISRDDEIRIDTKRFLGFSKEELELRGNAYEAYNGEFIGENLSKSERIKANIEAIRTLLAIFNRKNINIESVESQVVNSFDDSNRLQRWVETKYAEFSKYKFYEDYPYRLVRRGFLALNLEISTNVENVIKATKEEQKILAKYSGFGGLKEFFNQDKYKEDLDFLKEHFGEDYIKELETSSENAYFTPSYVIDSMYSGLKNFGSDKLGKVKALEPSCGIGKFFANAPSNFEFEGVEADLINANIAKLLFPQVKIQHSTLENTLFLNEFDIVLGNPPYSQEICYDYKSKGDGLSAHNYFMVKASELVKEGGILNFIITKSFMDAKTNTSRKILANKNMGMLAGLRLPNSVFKNTNAEVMSDILYFYKNIPEEEKDKMLGTLDYVETRGCVISEFSNESGYALYDLSSYLKEYERFPSEDEFFSINEYFYKNTDFLLGYIKPTTNRFGEKDYKLDLQEYFDSHIHYTNFEEHLRYRLDKKNLLSLTHNTFSSAEIDRDKTLKNTLAKNFYEQTIPYHLMPQKQKQYIKSLLPGNAFIFNEKAYIKEDEGFCREAYFVKELSLEEIDTIPKDRILQEKKSKFTYKEPLTEKDLMILDAILEYRDILKENIKNEQILPNDEKSNDFIMHQKHLLVALRLEILYNYDKMNKTEGYFNRPYRDRKENGVVVQHSLQSIINLDKLDSYRIYASENVRVKDGRKKGIISEFLQKRIHYPFVKTLATDEVEALQKSIVEKGKLDLENLQSYLPQTPLKDILEKLVEKKLIYPNIFSQETEIFNEESMINYDDIPFVLKNEFFSGNIKEKLIKLEELESKLGNTTIGLADLKSLKSDLENVLPDRIPLEKINFGFGSNFIDNSIYLNFFNTFFKIPKNTAVRCLNGIHIFISLEDRGKSLDFSNYSEFAKELMIYNEKGQLAWSITEFINAVISNKSLIVKHSEDHPYKSGETIYVKEPQSSQRAMENAELLKRAFLDFVYSNQEACKVIEDRYNDTINVLSKEKLDFSEYFLKDSLSSALIPRPHQNNAFFKGVLSSSLLLDHKVGAGKTLVCAMLAMEQKRMGLIKKAFICTSNHLVGQFANEILRAYPNANLLVGDKINSKKERKEFLHKARFGEFDAIIIKHSTFENMRILEEYQKDFLDKKNAELDEIEAEIKLSKGKENDIGIKGINYASRKKKSIEEFSKVLNKRSVDYEIALEDLGCDCFIIDEIQEFKNLMVLTAKDNVKGLPSRASQKAIKMYCATQWIADNNYKLYLATGTPISNSIAEMFVMQSFIQPKLLESLNLHNFDSWANNFTFINPSEELDSTGVNFTIVNRLNSFINVPELISIYSQNADIIDNDDIKKQNENKSIVPSLEGGKPINVIAPKSPLQEAYIGIEDDNGEFNEGSLCYRAEHFSDDPNNNNMLKILSDGAKASLDFRFIDKNAQDFENSKVNLCIKNVLDIYNDSTYEKSVQLIFCDLGVSKINSQKINTETDLNQNLNIESILKENKLVINKIYEDDNTYEEKFVKIYNSESNKEITNPKYNEKGEIILRENEEITEILNISDLLELQGGSFNVYGDILQKLVKNGILQKEIAFIGDCTNDKQKQALFDKVNSGEVRILIGSTQKMGAGTNVQQRVVAMHELTCPYRPSDLEQRQGRVIRQGNIFYEQFGDNFKIKSYRYATAGTLDARMYQINESKLNAINMLKTSKTREIESIDEAQIAIAEMKSEATGNIYIMEQQKIQGILNREELLEKSYYSRVLNAKQELEILEQRLKIEKESLEAVNNIAFLNIPSEFRVKAFGIETFKTSESFSKSANAIEKHFSNCIENGDINKIVFDLEFVKVAFTPSFKGSDLTLNGYLEKDSKKYYPNNMAYSINKNTQFSLSGLLTRITNAFKIMNNTIISKKEEIKRIERDINDARNLIEKGKNGYERTPYIKTLREDLSNIKYINQYFREFKKQGLPTNEDNPEIKKRLPKYHQFLDSNGFLDLKKLSNTSTPINLKEVKEAEIKRVETRKAGIKKQEDNNEETEIKIKKEFTDLQNMLEVIEFNNESIIKSKNAKRIIGLPARNLPKGSTSSTK